MPKNHADTFAGLTSAQVEDRKKNGLDNRDRTVKTKPIRKIIAEHFFTYFNFINFFMAALLFIVGSYRNMLFIFVVLANLLIGIVQSIRAKLTIDRMSLIVAPQIDVFRDGICQTINADDLVQDDLAQFSAGRQVCADFLVLQGKVEVDESLLTGESVAVFKQPGDLLFSGSFILSGNCKAKAENVGKNSYAAKIASAVKKEKKNNSVIIDGLNRIIRWVSFIIIPLGILMFCKQYYLLHMTIPQDIAATVGSMIGLIPQGMILLTSMVLAVGVIRLSKHKTLVQELFCIESLARVDVLCLDKTGTITEGNICMKEIVPLTEEFSPHQILGAMFAVLEDQNDTAKAIRAWVKEPTIWKPKEMVPFSSERKWCGVAFETKGNFLLGAGEFLMKNPPKEMGKYARAGYRTLLLAHAETWEDKAVVPSGLQPVALLILEDCIRKDAKQILQFFDDAGVQIKIISGDHAETVAEVAKRANVPHGECWADATHLEKERLQQLAEKTTVFGRTTPEQKKEIIQALQQQGHTVAMVGDGINDVLALRQADCSIAVASGSDATRNVSQMILLDSGLAAMYQVVMEGRRAINNIENASSLALLKTVFSFLLAMVFLFLPLPYPFVPIQLTLVSVLMVGIPSVVLGLQPNHHLVKKNFLQNILNQAVPNGLSVGIMVLLITAIGGLFHLSHSMCSTLSLIAVGGGFSVALIKACMPFNWLRSLLCIAMIGAYAIGILFFYPVFYLEAFSWEMLLVAGGSIVFFLPLHAFFRMVVEKNRKSIQTNKIA